MLFPAIPCFVPPVHELPPLLRDGVENFRLYHEGYNGVGCVWSRRVVVTPDGPTGGPDP